LFTYNVWVGKTYSNSIQKTKTLLHIDGDAFFVGVEVAKNPKLKGLPVVTGEERGIVSALSYEAKALGVVRGMPIFKLKKEFPNVIILPGDYKSYVEYSNSMFEIVRRYADDVEEYSIDECFADLTGLDRTLKMTYKEIAERIKKEINEELRLSVSIGLAPTKVLAKVASKWVKPNGFTIIEKESASDFLKNFQIEKIWGIGPKTSEFLKSKGIQTAGDFTEKNSAWVEENLSKPYAVIWQELKGERILEIDPNLKTEYSSIQKTRSFYPNTNDKSFLLSELSKNIEGACAKARHYRLVPKKISFFLKTKDFKFLTSSITLPTPTSAPEIIIQLIDEKFEELYSKNVLFRTTGIILENLIPHQNMQQDLFGNTDRVNKFEIIHDQIDKLENKFGRNMVYLAGTEQARKNRTLGTDSDDLDKDLLFL
jgi:nucleotidyltransferase/DNA polymerase involved in DNA repair